MTSDEPPRPHARRTAGTVLALVTGLLLAGCGSTSHSGTAASVSAASEAPAATATITLISVPGAGQVLADGDGHALYMFPPDARRKVSCTGTCARIWPPEAVRKGATPTAGPGVNALLLGTLPDPNTGGRAVTYAGWPLYRYVGDPDPGTANGQALVANGGPWYLLGPEGRPVTVAAHSRA